MATIPSGGHSSGGHSRVKTLNGATGRMALLLMSPQLVAMALLLLVYRAPDEAFIWLHPVILAMDTVVAIWLSVWILSYWKSENNDPERPSPAPWMLGPLFIGLIVAVIEGTASYVRFFYANEFTGNSMIEGLNYSIQTVTTVGYGNWPLVRPTESQFRNVRICSIALMASGASLFAMVIWDANHLAARTEAQALGPHRYRTARRSGILRAGEPYRVKVLPRRK